MEKKFGITVGLCMIGLIACVTFLHQSITGDIERHDELMKVNVGKSVVVNGDTLEVTNYSIIGNEYTLSDGSTVNYEYVVRKLN